MVLVVAPMTAFWFQRCWVLHTELYISNSHTETFETINAQKQFSLSYRATTKMVSRMLVTKSGGTSKLLFGTKLFEFLQVKRDELLSWDISLAYNLVLIGARSPCFPQSPSFSSSQIIKLDYMQVHSSHYWNDQSQCKEVSSRFQKLGDVKTQRHCSPLILSVIWSYHPW